MPRVLLIKTSSLGDVVHNLPAADDILRSVPDCAVDWVVEEAYAAIPRLHPGLSHVIPVAVRRWRKTPWRRDTRAEMAAFVRRLRAARYDAVIDTQGLFKSALIARAARGLRIGLDWRSAREPLSWLYDRTFRVPWTLHAVERNRALAAQALGYAPPPRVRYGIVAAAVKFDWLARPRYAVFLHATSAAEKLWPEASWIALGRRWAAHGTAIVLPWAAAHERARSERLAAGIAGAIVPPALALGDAAALLANAGAVVGVDTGLTHLAAALGAATVGVYSATDPAATGVYGCTRGVNLGGIGRAPAVDEVAAALARCADCAC